LIKQLLPVVLKDNVKARELRPDGTYVRVTAGQEDAPVRSQAVFQTLARESARVPDSPFRFLPIFGAGGAPPPDSVVSNAGEGSQRFTPLRSRSRSRKRAEST
jgi:hypothetical protein